MNEQTGFDFGDEVAHRFEASAPGTWLHPQFTTAQYDAIFSKAAQVLPGVVGLTRELFERGLAAARAEHAEMVECSGADDQPYQLWRAECGATGQEFDQFIAHCRAMSGTGLADLESKVRDRRHGLRAALYVRDLGTLVAWRSSAGFCGIDFRPWRDAFLFDSFQDHMALIEASYSAWAPGYCADKLAFADQGVATVPTVVIQGREYIITSVSGNGRYQEGQAWTFCALADWRGPTYNYRSHCHAYDNGSVERGDHRGLIVRVRGELCVIDGAATIVDTQADTSPVVVDDGHGLVDADEGEDQADEETEVLGAH